MKLTKETFKTQVLDKHMPAMLSFFATWCKPSQLQKTDIDKLRENYIDRFYIEAINVDDNPELSEEYNSRTLPTTILFAKGEIVETLIGYQSPEYLESYIKHILDYLKKEKNKQTKQA